MSNDLQWLLLRNCNSYKVKRVPEGPIFSKEPGNLLNIHSYKYSGLANKKILNIHDTKNGIQIQTRKAKASPHQVKSGFTTTAIKARTGPRRALSIAAGFARRGYRPDLRRLELAGLALSFAKGGMTYEGSSVDATLARVSALVNAQKEPKPARPRKLRGKKAVATKA